MAKLDKPRVLDVMIQHEEGMLVEDVGWSQERNHV
jgi:hypothetical protein